MSSISTEYQQFRALAVLTEDQCLVSTLRLCSRGFIQCPLPASKGARYPCGWCTYMQSKYPYIIF